MSRILADANLPDVAQVFHPLNVTLFTDNNSLLEHIPFHDILICRSTLKVNEQLLKNTPVRLVGTATSGTEHLDKNWLEANQIRYMSAKGANAHAVADYVCITLAWLNKNKGWWGKKAGLIGCGKVGNKVKYRLESLGFSVYTNDPWRCDETNFKHHPLDALLDCDVICIHCDHHENLPYPSHHLLNQDFLQQYKTNGILINAARGGIVDEAALLESIHCENYCTDVYNNEPDINTHLLKSCMLATPHIAGHTIEAKYNAVIMLAQQIFEYLNIRPTHPLLKVSFPEINVNSKNPEWIDKVLSIYNPGLDSQALKISCDIAQDFKRIRKAHNFRHDMNWL